MPSESDGGNGSEGTSGASAEARGGLGGYGGSYVDPDLSLMTNTPKSGLSQADREPVAAVREALDNGTLSRSDLDRALSGHSDSAAGLISFIGSALLGKVGALGAKAINSALKSQDPMSAMRGLAEKAQSGGATSGFNGTNGDYRNGDATNSISNTGEPAVSSLVADAFNPGSTSGNAAFSDWTGQKAGLDAQAGDINTRGNAAYDTLSILAQAPNTDLEALRSEVARYGTQAFQDTNAARAVADVQQAADAQYGATQRDMLRSGVDPSSGRALAMGNQRALGTALGTAQAANTSRANDATRYASGLNTVNTAANADRTQRMDLLTNANKLGASGFSAGADVAKLGLSFGTAADTASTNRYQAESGRINANNGVTSTANQQNQYDSSNDFWSNVTKAAGNNLVNTLTNPKSDLSIFNW